MFIFKCVLHRRDVAELNLQLTIRNADFRKVGAARGAAAKPRYAQRGGQAHADGRRAAVAQGRWLEVRAYSAPRPAPCVRAVAAMAATQSMIRWQPWLPTQSMIRWHPWLPPDDWGATLAFAVALQGV